MPKKVTVQYRYLKTDDLWDGIELKNMVVDVLRRAPAGHERKRQDLVRHRKLDLDADGSVVVLNKMSAPEAWDGRVFCGQLVHIRNSKELPGIVQSLDDDIAELDLVNFEMEGDNQLVDGVCYFAIWDNHVGLIEGQRARARTLERYLTRLLQDAEELEPGQVITLNARIEGLKADKIEAVEITPRRSPSSAGEARSEVLEEGLNKTVLDVLRVFGWDDHEIDQLQRSVPEGGWLEGLFRMKIRGKGREKASVDRTLLEEALRNLDPRSIGLLEPGGAREKNGLYKLSKQATIGTTGDLLDPTEAMQAIVQMLKSWGISGKIDLNY